MDSEASDKGARVSAQLQKLAEFVIDRVGGQSGFDFLMAFTSWNLLVEMCPEYDGSLFLNHREQVERFRRYLTSEDAKYDLILKLLDVVSLDERNPTAVALSQRMLRRMQIPSRDGSTVKPLLYTSTSRDGVATVLAVYDEFWTDRW